MYPDQHLYSLAIKAKVGGGGIPFFASGCPLFHHLTNENASLAILPHQCYDMGIPFWFLDACYDRVSTFFG